DPDLTPVRREDFTVKAAKADRAIKELQHGFTVSPDRIEDALDIPPRHLTPEKRVQLIHQLQQAKALDEQREQEILIYSVADVVLRLIAKLLLVVALARDRHQRHWQ